MTTDSLFLKDADMDTLHAEMSSPENHLNTTTTHNIRSNTRNPFTHSIHLLTSTPLYKCLFPQKLSLLSGVILPSTLNIFGVILFLRMSQIVGNVGLLWALALMALGYTINTTTILSLSAIATNGKMESGGSYLIVSRVLGAEFGAATGIMLYVANVTAGVLDMFGFVESFLTAFPALRLTSSDYVNNLLFSSATLLLLILVALTGARIFSKLSFLNIFLIAASIGTIFVTLFAQKPGSHSGDYTGFSAGTFRENLSPNWSGFISLPGLSAAFGVLYPAFSGFLCAFNVSGDLKSPSKDLPRGSLIACLITAATYFSFMLFICLTIKKSALMANTAIIGEISLFFPLQVVGILTSTLSASFMSYISCSRILQAMARDKIIPFTAPFATGVGSNKEPVLALLFTWFVAQCICFVGRIDFVAPFVSLFFIVVYCINNSCCFLLCVAYVPNFRPTFRLYSWWTALLGIIVTMGGMFLIQPLYASVVFLIVVSIIILVWLYSPAKSFGGVGKSVLFHQMRKHMLKTDPRNSHSQIKFWRFKPLILTANPRGSFDTLSFFNSLAKHKGGLATFAKIDTRDFRTSFKEHEEESKAMFDLAVAAQWQMYASRTHANSIREGARGLLTNAPSMTRPNTLVLGFYEQSIPRQCMIDTSSKRGQKIQQALSTFPPLPTEVKHSISLDEYMELVKDVLLLKQSLLITRNFHKLEEISLAPASLSERIRKYKHRYIDVWIFVTNDDQQQEIEPTIALTLQLAFLMKQSNVWKKYHKLRVIMIADQTSDYKLEREKIRRVLQIARIKAKVRVVHLTDDDLKILERLEKELGTQAAVAHAIGEDSVSNDTSSEGEDVHFEGVTNTWTNLVDTDDTITAMDTLEESVPVSARDTPFTTSSTSPSLMSRSNTAGAGGLNLSKSFSVEFEKKSVSIDDFQLQFPGTMQFRGLDGAPLSDMKKYTMLNHIIKSYSGEKASVVLLTLPSPPTEFDRSRHIEYHESLRRLTQDLPPTIMVYGLEQTISMTL
uniref:Amino acid permease/ SLC12A domain-containing protein n=1 Tax=Percolomonas cosmopolitus TaxID=63605 RepID=A0A7S1KMV0_9EUKA